MVRLADGPDPMSGRVEIRRSGIWGTICDDDFGPEEATVNRIWNNEFFKNKTNNYFTIFQVICRMLNFTGPAQPEKNGKFGPGRGPIWLDELGCSGIESNLTECSRLPWAKHNCQHTEDAAVKCSQLNDKVPYTLWFQIHTFFLNTMLSTILILFFWSE